jgi:hypothetical protein
LPHYAKQFSDEESGKLSEFKKPIIHFTIWMFNRFSSPVHVPITLLLERWNEFARWLKLAVTAREE